MGDLTIINVMNYGRNENGEKSVLDDAAVAQIQAMDGVIIATPSRPQTVGGAVLPARWFPARYTGCTFTAM